MQLIEYIDKYFGGNKSSFGRHMSVSPQQVNKWLNDEWIVVNGKIYAPRREIPQY